MPRPKPIEPIVTLQVKLLPSQRQQYHDLCAREYTTASADLRSYVLSRIKGAQHIRLVEEDI